MSIGNEKVSYIYVFRREGGDTGGEFFDLYLRKLYVIKLLTPKKYSYSN